MSAYHPNNFSNFPESFGNNKNLNNGILIKAPNELKQKEVSTNTTVNVTWDSGSLSSETLVIYLAALSKTNDSIPEDSISSAKLNQEDLYTKLLIYLKFCVNDGCFL